MNVVIAYDPKYTSSMDIHENRDFPCIQNRSKVRYVGSESKNQNSEKKNFQSTLHVHVKIFR